MKNLTWHKHEDTWTSEDRIFRIERTCDGFLLWRHGHVVRLFRRLRDAKERAAIYAWTDKGV
jgi:hypothetical protein